MRFRPLHIVLAGMLSAFGTVHATEVIENDQDNNGIGNAQEVTFSGDTLVIKGAVGNVGFPKRPDLDYYKFYGQDGDVVTVNIDGGYGGDGKGDVDTIVALFKTDDNFTVLEQSGDLEDNQPVDEGSDNRMDPRIDEIRLPYTGFYIVGVASEPYKEFLHGGGTWPTFSLFSPQTNGDYTLVISGVSSPVVNINIEIKPGTGAGEANRSAKASKRKSAKLRPLNHESKGKIPVALLSSFEFDPMMVDPDPDTLTFGRTGEERSLSRCPSKRDVNRDGRLDLVCLFEAEIAGFDPDDTSALVRGQTVDGAEFKGRGAYDPVPRGR